MVQAGWLPQPTDPVAALQDALNFFGVASPEALSQIGDEKCLAFRPSDVHQVDQYALLAWIRKGEIKAQQQQCAPYDEKQFRAALAEIRKLTRATVDAYAPRMAHLCTAAGVALVFVPEIPGARMGRDPLVEPRQGGVATQSSREDRRSPVVHVFPRSCAHPPASKTRYLRRTQRNYGPSRRRGKSLRVRLPDPASRLATRDPHSATKCRGYPGTCQATRHNAQHSRGQAAT